jgi:hypothetical protein
MSLAVETTIESRLFPTGGRGGGEKTGESIGANHQGRK